MCDGMLLVLLLVAAGSVAMRANTIGLHTMEDERDLMTINETLLHNITMGESAEQLKCLIAAEEGVPEDHCAPSYDKVLCWPAEPAGTLSVQPCFESFNGLVYDPKGRNATRLCTHNATWEEKTNYKDCMVLKQVETLEPSNEIEDTTSTIYYVGYTVSTVALTIAVSIFSYFSELHCLRNMIHMNLMLSYIGADIVWILNMTVNVYLMESISKAFCFIFVVLLHYTLLTQFLWMFVEGLYLYTLVVQTFQQNTAKLSVYMVIGWVSPVVLVVAWVITRYQHPIPQEDAGPNMESLYKECPWMMNHWSDWIYQAPCIAVLCVNCIFLVFVMYVLITKLRTDSTMRAGRGRGGKAGGGAAGGDSEQQQSKKAAKALLVLIPLLGITYILVIAGPSEGEAGNVFAQVRAVLLSTQARAACGAVLLLPQHGRASHAVPPLGALAGRASHRAAAKRPDALRQLDAPRHGVLHLPHHGRRWGKVAGRLQERPRRAARRLLDGHADRDRLLAADAVQADASDDAVAVRDLAVVHSRRGPHLSAAPRVQDSADRRDDVDRLCSAPPTP